MYEMLNTTSITTYCVYLIFAAIFNALKNKENGFIAFQELASFFKLLLPSTLPQANINAIVTDLLHQTDCSSEDDTLSPEHRRLSFEDFTKVFYLLVSIFWCRA